MKLSTVLLGLVDFSLACSNTRLHTPEGDVIGRTMELGGSSGILTKALEFTNGLTNTGGTLNADKTDQVMPWEIAIHPAQQNKNGMILCHDSSGWQSKLGFVSIDIRIDIMGVHGIDFVTDGMNEAGLTISAQLMHGAKYQTPPAASVLRPKLGAANLTASPEHICWGDFPAWVLGNFKSVAELRQTLEDPTKILTVGPRDALQGNSFIEGFRTHWSVDDAEGGNIIVEYTKGELKIHNNTVGTMTNDPPFEWQLQNLGNYVNLQPGASTGAGRIQVSSEIGMVPQNLGAGSNTLGLPGDYTAASRFVKLFYLKQFAMLNNPSMTIEAAIPQVTGLLNTVFIPKGVVATAKPFGSEFTQYSVMKVPQKKMYYYKDFFDNQWRMLDISRMDLTKAKYKFVTEGSLGIKDTTTTLFDNP